MDHSGYGTPHQNSHATPGVTRNEYDALADLFLDDAAFGAAPTPVHTPSPTVIATQQAAPAATHLHLTNAPAVSLPAQPHTGEAPNVWRLVGDSVLGDAPVSHIESEPPPAPAVSGRIIVEAIVQGHLPIFASAWVPQYARSIVQETQSAVALIRVRHGQISVERFALDSASSAALPKHATLAEAVESARAARVLVQVDEIAEPDLWRTPGLDRITVLTGADEAAMVACYRTLKTIGQELSHDLSPDAVEDVGTPSTPALAIAVLGATSERAAQTITRIQRAATNFLSRQVHGSHAAGRIGSGSSQTLFRGVALDGDSSPVALIALIRASADIAQESARTSTPFHTPVPPTHTIASQDRSPFTPAQPVTPAQRTTPGQRTSAWERVAARLEEKLGPATTPAAQFESKPIAAAPQPAAPSADSDYDLIDLTDLHSTDVVPPASPTTAAAVDATSAPEAMTPDHPHLATFVDELLAIDEHCPYAETVEFALAADGRLHLLVHTGNCTHTGHPGGQGRALEELTTASSWAVAHARAFQKSHAHIKLDDIEHRPILHLITDRPREAKRLLESDIRIHLVAPVDPQARFVCRDLN
ncbi:MAG: hypothetical protein KGS45_08650 [Planctomycetes bacterium]|nr:hypothetical protein [Planctomycetota bacterium]